MNIRLRAEDDEIEFFGGDPALVKTISDRQRRMRTVQPCSLLADESLLLHGGDNVIAVQQAGSAVV